MKENFYSYTVDTDVSDVECDLYDATLIIKTAKDGKLRAELPKARNVRAGNVESALYVSQIKRRLIKTSGQVITVYVPEYLVPSIKLSGTNYSVKIEDGIYGDLNVNAQRATVEASNCSLNSLEIMCGRVDAKLSSVTIKGNLFIQAKEGDALAENAFVSHCEAHLKSGNIGLVKLSLKEGVFDTGLGNITATIDGKEEDYSLSIMAKEGTANRESSPESNAEKTIKAYTEKGNIVIDFLEKNDNGEII